MFTDEIEVVAEPEQEAEAEATEETATEETPADESAA